MSSFTVTNSTNGNSNTLPTTLSPGGTIPLTGYTEQGSSITYTSLVNPTIESCTTDYLQSGTDIGNQYCVTISSQIISNPTSSPAGPAPEGIQSGTIPVSNYSSCSIIMCGGGGGGGGAGGSSFPGISPGSTPGTFAGGAGGAGGDGALVIINRYPLSDINTISYSVPRVVNGGLGGNNGFPGPGNAGQNGQPGGACIITFSDGNSITTNGGSGGNRGTGGNRSNRTPGTAGTSGTNGNIVSTITYTPYPAPTSTNFVNLIYNDTNDVIQVSSPATVCCQGGAGGNTTTIGTPAANAGGGGRAVFVRIYLYP